MADKFLSVFVLADEPISGQAGNQIRVVIRNLIEMLSNRVSHLSLGLSRKSLGLDQKFRYN